MALAGSGTISIGGSTATRSINLELGRSATATSNMGETDLRSLAGVSSGAISMDDFYGASAGLFSVALVRGSVGGTTADTRGNGFAAGGYGTVAGGTTYTLPASFGSSTAVRALTSMSMTWNVYSGRRQIQLTVGAYNATGTTNNAGFTTITITNSVGTATYSRTAGTYVSIQNGAIRLWSWDLVTGVSSSAYNTFAAGTSNPFGASDGVSVTFGMQ